MFNGTIRAAHDRLQAIGEVARSLDSFSPDPRAAADSRPIILFGVGPLGQMTLAHLRHLGTVPFALADNNRARWGNVLDGLPILQPAEAARLYAKTARFVVTIYNGSAARQQLRDLGCDHVSHFSELYFEQGAEFLPFCGLAPRSAILDSWAEVATGAHLWHDVRSTDEYVAQIAWRLRLPEYELPPHDPPSRCYFPNDLYRFLDEEVLFDCGAFEGDSLRQFLALRPAGGIPKVVAFEPDAGSFAGLAAYAKTLTDKRAADIRIEPWAVTQQTGEVGFAALGSVRSGIAEAGTTRVAGIAIDDLDLIPTMIKMDVEGFELAALKGASRVLRQHRPVLAISLYHHASDLWAIPSFLKTLVPDYRLFLRRYAEDCWELVLYAVPNERLVQFAEPLNQVVIS